MKERFKVFVSSAITVLLMATLALAATEEKTTVIVEAANGCVSETYADDVSVYVFDDGGKDYTFFVNGEENHYFVPPKGFEPINASDEMLARYGFPERPDEGDTDEYNYWCELMSNYASTPELDYSVEIIPVSSIEDPDGGDIESLSSSSTEYSYNWSGYVAYTDNSERFTEIQMDYTQPTVVSNSTGTSRNAYWVGFGGYNSGNLVQAGTETKNGSSQYAWYEYLSETGDTVSEIVLNGLSVSAGDSIHLLVTYQRANNIFGYYIANNTTGVSASGTVTLDASIYYDGTTAEWIIERTKVNGSLALLGNYGSMTLSNCKATINTSNDWCNFTDFNLYRVIMSSTASSSGTKLSVPAAPLNSSTFVCTWQNSGG